MPGTSISSSNNPNVSTYSKVLPVSIRKDVGAGNGGGDNSPSSTSGGEQREFIRVTLAFPSPSCGTMNPHKEIVLRLTNDDNPLFYYHLKVTDAEFPHLRFQQGLLVDFYGFPGQLVTLLDKCDLNTDTNEDSLKHLSFGNGPKFVLVMKVAGGGNTVLDIVESNPFKYLCHLSLQIIPGSDAEVKKFLCDVTTTIKKDYQLLHDKYNHLTSTMEAESNRIKSLLENKCTELNLLRDEIHSQANSLSSKHFQEMNQEKEKLLSLQSDLVSKFDSERAEIEKRHKATMRALEDRNTALEGENRDLSVCKFKQETALQDATNRLKIYEDDFKILQQEITVARKQNVKLDQDYHEKQRLVNTLQNKNTTLESDLKDKQNMVHRQQEIINSTSNDKRRLEDNLQEVTKELDKSKLVHKTTAQELVKANEIIKKLQDDIRNSHSKIKLQTLITAEHERNLQDREKRLLEIRKEFDDCKQTLTQTDQELKKKELELEVALKTIQEKEETLSSQENMITWLNKQLNELQGLSDLSKFRSNLSMPMATNSSKNEPAPKHISGRLLPLPEHNNSNTHHGQPNSDSTNNNHVTSKTNNNTTAGGSPSWLHIYQSTGNSNNQNLSSRLEHITALGSILNSQNTKNVGKNRPSNDSNDLVESTSMGKPHGNSNVHPNSSSTVNNVKQPTWAKSKAKVTLDNMINKPTFPIWKNK